MFRRSRDRVLDNAMKRLLHQFLSGNFGELGAGNFMNGLPHFAAEFSPITDFLDCCRPEVRLLSHHDYVGHRPAAAPAHR